MTESRPVRVLASYQSDTKPVLFPFKSFELLRRNFRTEAKISVLVVLGKDESLDPTDAELEHIRYFPNAKYIFVTMDGRRRTFHLDSDGWTVIESDPEED